MLNVHDAAKKKLTRYLCSHRHQQTTSAAMISSRWRTPLFRFPCCYQHHTRGFNCYTILFCVITHIESGWGSINNSSTWMQICSIKMYPEHIVECYTFMCVCVPLCVGLYASNKALNSALECVVVSIYEEEKCFFQLHLRNGITKWIMGIDGEVSSYLL